MFSSFNRHQGRGWTMSRIHNQYIFIRFIYIYTEDIYFYLKKSHNCSLFNTKRWWNTRTLRYLSTVWNRLRTTGSPSFYGGWKMWDHKPWGGTLWTQHWHAAPMRQRNGRRHTLTLPSQQVLILSENTIKHPCGLHMKCYTLEVSISSRRRRNISQSPADRLPLKLRYA